MASRTCGACNRQFEEQQNEDDRVTCPGCGRALCPRHSTWPVWLKWWVIVEFARARFYPHLTEQYVWERLLADCLNGSRFGAQANPDGYKANQPASDMYSDALARALAWKKSGSHLDRVPQPKRSINAA